MFAEQQTVAKNPCLVPAASVLNLTVMVVAEIGPVGVVAAVLEKVWVDEPGKVVTSTVSQRDSVLNTANVSVIGSPVVDSSLHS